MIAVDTDILVCAHREDSEWHQAASQRLAELAEGRGAWAIPWPACTGPRCVRRASSIRQSWSADHDFGRFHELTVVNPLVAS